MRRLGSSVLAMAIAVAASGSGTVGAAEPASPAAHDPLPGTSFVVVGTGLGVTTLGALLLSTAPSAIECGGVAGCLPARTDHAWRAGTSTMIGGGIGLAAVGAVGAAVTWSSPLASRVRRDVPAAATAGLISVLSAALVETEMRDPVAVGVGLGLVITGVAGGAALISQVGEVGGSSSGNIGPDFSGLGDKVGLAFSGLCAIGAGLGVGIPLLVHGQKQVPIEEHPTSDASFALTSVTVGAGSAQATWSF